METFFRTEEEAHEKAYETSKQDARKGNILGEWTYGNLPSCLSPSIDSYDTEYGRKRRKRRKICLWGLYGKKTAF